jgi:hypothetical protein
MSDRVSDVRTMLDVMFMCIEKRGAVSSFCNGSTKKVVELRGLGLESRSRGCYRVWEFGFKDPIHYLQPLNPKP